MLIPLVEREELTVLLTQRASQLRHHAGQVSFPGGRMDPGDVSPEAAALREAREEIGLDAGFVSVIGYLPDHLVITGFRVTPVVAFVRPGFTLKADPAEVEATFEVPLKYIFDPANHHPVRRRSPFTGEEVNFLDITYENHTIWGATSGMLMTLYRLSTAPERS
ncbi:MAG TPA: CoA pyrophosphatase [Steroidobacteraceae bacterium]